MAIAGVVTYLATFVVRKLADKYNIYPKAIRSRDMHLKPTPRIGGLAMFIGFVVSVSIAAPIGWFEVVFADPGPIIAISLAALVVMAIGFLDDLFDLDWTIKLAGQFLAAGVLAWNGVQIVSLPIFGITVGSFGVSFVVTVFLAVLVMNAVNFIDGLDGLVAGVVAVLPLILPISILLLPLLDFALAVLRRLAAGKSPFAADRLHLHHKLQDFGHGHVGSVLVFYFWSASVSVSCLLLFLTDFVWVAIFAVSSISLSLLYTLWPAIIRFRSRKKLANV